MSQLATRLLLEPVRSLAFGSIVAGYTGVGTAISNPARMLYIANLTDASLMFSFDGINDHFPLVTNGYMILDISANKTLSGHFYLAEGDRLYVKRIGVPGSGSVYFTVFYGKI
jgi:hypothetical protein